MNFPALSLAAIAVSMILSGPAVAQTENKTDEKIGLEVEAYALMCISSYVGQTVEQGKKVAELPRSHPIFFWFDVGETTAEKNKRDWVADRSIVTMNNISRRGIFGDAYIAAEDKKIIDNCDKVQKSFEADQAASLKK